MLKNNVKKIITSLMAIILILSVANVAYATGGSVLDEINEMLKEEGQIVEDNENLQQIPEGTNTNTNTNTNKNVNENLPETTPHAGISDYSGLVFIAIFAVSAIYAYKKVKNYNA